MLYPCSDHQPVDHGDNKQPWCDSCGRTWDSKLPEFKVECKTHIVYDHLDNKEMWCDGCGRTRDFNIPSNLYARPTESIQFSTVREVETHDGILGLKPTPADADISEHIRKADVPIPPLPDAPNLVNHPPHYNSHPSGIECIEVTRHMCFNLGNVVKYLWRDGLKDTSAPLEDLRKALWYLQDEIAMREEREK